MNVKIFLVLLLFGVNSLVTGYLIGEKVSSKYEKVLSSKNAEMETLRNDFLKVIIELETLKHQKIKQDLQIDEVTEVILTVNDAVGSNVSVHRLEEMHNEN